MPINGAGWEMHIVRTAEQDNGEQRRTVGRYQIFQEGVARTGTGMSGMVAETKGPGANTPINNGLRVEAGRYPLATQDGDDYVTFGFAESEDEADGPKPGLELSDTGERTAILIHPGAGFLRSIGCINPCTSLPNANEPIFYAGRRRRGIA